MDGKQIAVAVPSEQADVAMPGDEGAGDTHDVRGESVELPLVRLAWARSGDKGNNSNIGVIARRAEWLPLLRAQLTPTAVRNWLAHLVEGEVTRYEVPGIGAFNFLCTRALDGGGIASLRNDPLGKGMGQILLTMPVRIPAAMLELAN